MRRDGTALVPLRPVACVDSPDALDWNVSFRCGSVRQATLRRRQRVPLEVGQVVQIRLDLPQVSQSIEVAARVTWSVEDKAGFVFLDLKPDDQTIVGEFAGRQAASDDDHQPEKANVFR